MAQRVFDKREARRLIISLAKRHQRPGTGSAISFLTRRTAVARFPDIGAILGTMCWAVAGAVATRLYMPERVTQDLDIVVALKDAREARERLEKAGFKYQGELSVGGSTWAAPRRRRRVDVVESSEEWIEAALAEAQNNRDAQGLPILPLPYLVLMKFQSGRSQDIADVSRMLGQADEETLERVRQLFSGLALFEKGVLKGDFAPEDMEDLESLITLGRLEFE